MKASTKRSLMILISILILIASITAYSYLIKPLYNEILSLKTQELSLIETFNTYSSLNEQFQNVLSEYRNSSNLSQLSIIFPSKLDIPYAINQVAGIAKLNNLEVQSLTVKPLAISSAPKNLKDGEVIKGFGTLRISVKLAGSYENFKSFLKGIETNIMISNVADFKIEGQSLPSQPLIFTASIDTYYQDNQ